MFPTKEQIHEDSHPLAQLTRLLAAIRTLLLTEQWRQVADAVFEQAVTGYMPSNQRLAEMRWLDKEMREMYHSVQSIRNGDDFSETQKKAITVKFNKAAAARTAFAKRCDQMTEDVSKAMESLAVLEDMVTRLEQAHPKQVKAAKAFCAFMEQAAIDEFTDMGQRIAMNQPRTSPQIVENMAKPRVKKEVKKGKLISAEPVLAAKRVKPGSQLAKASR